MTKLTPKQARFAHEYLIDLNATQAAIRAGYSAGGADTAGPRLLEYPQVVEAIAAGKIARSERTEVDSDWVLQRLFLEADADIADLYHKETGELLPVHEWPEIFRKGLVAGVETEQLYDGQGAERVHVGTKYKVRFDSRIRRIELIGKHVRVNAFEDTITVKGLEGLSDRMERAKARAEERLRAVDAHYEEVPAAVLPALEPDPTPLPVKAPAVLPPFKAASAPSQPKPGHRPIMPAVAAPSYGGAFPTARPFPADVGSADVNYDPLD